MRNCARVAAANRSSRPHRGPGTSPAASSAWSPPGTTCPPTRTCSARSRAGCRGRRCLRGAICPSARAGASSTTSSRSRSSRSRSRRAASPTRTGTEQRAKVEMKKFRIVAARVNELPGHPDSGLWQKAPPIDLHLMPLWWRADRPEELTVRALHDGNELAILLSWADTSHDATATARPPTLRPSPLEHPPRHALTLQSDPTYVTAWGAGNIVADPTRKSAAEDLRAEGFGTLRARPRRAQSVDAVGVYETGAYHVQLRRALRGGKADAG